MEVILQHWKIYWKNYFSYACICLLSSPVIHSWNRKEFHLLDFFLHSIRHTPWRISGNPSINLATPAAPCNFFFLNPQRKKKRLTPLKPEASSVPKGERGCRSCLSKMWKRRPVLPDRESHGHSLLSRLTLQLPSHLQCCGLRCLRLLSQQTEMS